MESASCFQFSNFELDPAQGVLLRGAKPAPLNPRAFKLLEFLVRNSGRLVSKDEIMEHVWDGLIVEENNLAVQISTLRKALGDGPQGQPFIVNVPGRGYRFVAPISNADDEASEPSETEPPVAARPSWLRRHGRVIGFVAAALGFSAITANAYWFATGGRPEPQRLSIAVMPFRSLSADAEQGYLADAVSDDLTTDLARLPGSFVIARESADTYRDKPTTAQQVGQELNVRYILEGSVRPADDRLSINAQLIDSGTGAHLWAEQFDTSRNEMGAAQREIVRRIASALHFRLVQIESARSIAARPDDPDALDLFFRARSMLDRDRSPKGLDAAQKLLEEALQKQPDFVDAINELAALLLRRVLKMDNADQRDYEEAQGLVARALALDPQNARSATNRGELMLIDGHCQEAVSAFRFAISLNSSSLAARDGLSICGNIFGKPDDTIQALREAIALSPEDPQTKERYGHMGMALLLADRPNEAIDWLRKAEMAQSEPVETFERGLIEADALVGRLGEARQRLSDYSRRWSHRSVWRETCYASSKAASHLPGLKRALAGLKEAGMPEFADEAVDDGVAPMGVLQPVDLYAATPRMVSGADTLTTAEFSALTASDLKPVVLDVGCGSAAAPGTLFLPWVEDGDRLDDVIQSRLAKEMAAATGSDPEKPIVVMGSGVYGWGPYNTVLRLKALGYRKLYWYRGGEEALAAAHLPTEDRRDP